MPPALCKGVDHGFFALVRICSNVRASTAICACAIAATTRPPQALLAALRARAIVGLEDTAQAAVAARTGHARTAPAIVEVAGTGQAASASVLAPVSTAQPVVEVAGTGQAAPASVLAPVSTAARVGPAHTATAAAVSARAIAVDVQTSECLAWNL